MQSNEAAVVPSVRAPIIFLAALSSQLRTAEAEPGGKATGQDGSSGGRVEGGEVCLLGRPVFLSLWREGSLC